MSLLAAWVLFPAVLALASGGAGLLVGSLAGRQLPGVLVVPAGFALILALVNLLCSGTGSAGLALPAVIVVALAGFLLGRRRLRPAGLDRWAALAAIGVVVTLGAPAALTGSPTFSGSLSLPDTANQMILASQLAHSGRDYQHLAPSSFQVSAAKYLSSQYPVAAQATLGVLSPLGFQDLAWLYQPFLAYMLAVAALAIYGLLASVSAPVRRSRRAAVAFLAAQPALVYSFALQGSIKEVGAVCTLAAVFALSADAISRRAGARSLLPVAVSAAAALGVLGPAALVYLAIPGVAVAGAWVWGLTRRGASPGEPRPWIRETGWAVVVLGVLAGLSAPVLAGARTAYTVSSAVLSMAADLGNLANPLKLVQASGVWMGGDYRYTQDYPTLGVIAMVAIAIAGLLGLGWAVRRRALGPLLMIGTLLPVSARLLEEGSPYADSKVLMVLSPAVVLAAALGVVWVDQSRGRLLTVILAVPVALGVLGSNALAYHAVQNAPYARYAELLKINEKFAGQGPTLLTEYDEFSGYFLRDVRVQSEPESVLGYRGPPERRPSGLQDPRHRPSVKSPLDIDDLTTSYVQSRDLIVTRHSPTTSRPPADFRRVFTGRFYDVWRHERGANAPRVLAHVPLGKNVFSPGGLVRCHTVRSLARRGRRVGARLAYVSRPALISTNPLVGPLPNGWFEFGGYPRSVVPSGPGRVARTVRLYAGGPYRLWLEGSFGRTVHVAVDGHETGSVSYQAGNAGQYFAVGDVKLTPGLHRIVVSRGGGDLRPGDGGGTKSSLRHIGPVVLSPAVNEHEVVQSISPGQAGELCGRRLDWIELVTRR